MAARRVRLEPPSSKADERRVERLQAEAAVRIGKRLKQLRLDAGLTLRQLEARSNVSATHLGVIERGKKSPTADILVRLGFYLQVPPASFLSDED